LLLHPFWLYQCKHPTLYIIACLFLENCLKRVFA
jgi:hypothetical protein